MFARPDEWADTRLYSRSPRSNEPQCVAELGLPGSTSTTDTLPGSFEATLDALAEAAPGRIIFMFGADGDRDTDKRGEMGRIAAKGSDVVIVCDYHPRSEPPEAIRAQLIEGALSAHHAEVLEVPDAREAIRRAISLAAPGDVILYASPRARRFSGSRRCAACVLGERRSTRGTPRGGNARVIALTPSEIADAIGGRLVRARSGADETPIAAQSQTDSREVAPGEIFVARRGEETDGHLFAAQAVDRGAALLIVEREIDDRVPQIVVDDATCSRSAAWRRPSCGSPLTRASCGLSASPVRTGRPRRRTSSPRWPSVWGRPLPARSRLTTRSALAHDAARRG